MIWGRVATGCGLGGRRPGAAGRGLGPAGYRLGPAGLAEDEGSDDAGDVGEGGKAGVEESVVGCDVADGYFEQEVGDAGDPIAFHDLGKVDDFFLEGCQHGVGVTLQLDGCEGNRCRGHWIKCRRSGWFDTDVAFFP